MNNNNLQFPFAALMIVSVCLLGCRDKERQKVNVIDIDTSNVALPSFESRQQGARLVNIDAKLLEGVWWLNENDPSALFYIYGDTLSYVEDQSHPYVIKVKNDTMVMIQNEREFLFRVTKLNRDSLIFLDLETDVEVVVFHKRK
jgi:hypothetical protein